MLLDVAAEAWSLARGFDHEVSMLSLVRGGRAAPLLALAVGSPDSVRADPRLLFRLGLSDTAEAVVLAHNHIDDVPPSAADLAVTRRLVAAGAVVGLPLLGHVVVTRSGWYDCVAGSFVAW